METSVNSDSGFYHVRKQEFPFFACAVSTD